MGLCCIILKGVLNILPSLFSLFSEAKLLETPHSLLQSQTQQHILQLKNEQLCAEVPFFLKPLFNQDMSMTYCTLQGVYFCPEAPLILSVALL